MSSNCWYDPATGTPICPGDTGGGSSSGSSGGSSGSTGSGSGSAGSGSSSGSSGGSTGSYTPPPPPPEPPSTAPAEPPWSQQAYAYVMEERGYGPRRRPRITPGPARPGRPSGRGWRRGGQLALPAWEAYSGESWAPGPDRWSVPWQAPEEPPWGVPPSPPDRGAERIAPGYEKLSVPKAAGWKSQAKWQGVDAPEIGELAPWGYVNLRGKKPSGRSGWDWEKPMDKMLSKPKGWSTWHLDQGTGVEPLAIVDYTPVLEWRKYREMAEPWWAPGPGRAKPPKSPWQAPAMAKGTGEEPNLIYYEEPKAGQGYTAPWAGGTVTPQGGSGMAALKLLEASADEYMDLRSEGWDPSWAKHIALAKALEPETGGSWSPWSGPSWMDRLGYFRHSPLGVPRFLGDQAFAVAKAGKLGKAKYLFFNPFLYALGVGYAAATTPWTGPPTPMATYSDRGVGAPGSPAGAGSTSDEYVEWLKKVASKAGDFQLAASLGFLAGAASVVDPYAYYETAKLAWDKKARSELAGAAAQAAAGDAWTAGYMAGGFAGAAAAGAAFLPKLGVGKYVKVGPGKAVKSYGFDLAEGAARFEYAEPPWWARASGILGDVIFENPRARGGLRIWYDEAADALRVALEKSSPWRWGRQGGKWFRWFRGKGRTGYPVDWTLIEFTVHEYAVKTRPVVDLPWLGGKSKAALETWEFPWREGTARVFRRIEYGEGWAKVTEGGSLWKGGGKWPLKDYYPEAYLETIEVRGVRRPGRFGELLDKLLGPREYRVTGRRWLRDPVAEAILEPQTRGTRGAPWEGYSPVLKGLIESKDIKAWEAKTPVAGPIPVPETVVEPGREEKGGKTGKGGTGEKHISELTEDPWLRVWTQTKPMILLGGLAPPKTGGTPQAQSDVPGLDTGEGEAEVEVQEETLRVPGPPPPPIVTPDWRIEDAWAPDAWAPEPRAPRQGRAAPGEPRYYEIVYPWVTPRILPATLPFMRGGRREGRRGSRRRGRRGSRRRVRRGR